MYCCRLRLFTNSRVEKKRAFTTYKKNCRIETSSEKLFSELHDCFGEIGTLNTTHHIEVKDNVKPVVTPVRKVPHALKPKLERIVDLDIIELTEKSTNWVNGLVIVEKPNGKPDICLDPRPLNNAIKREQLPLSNAEKIFSQLSGAYFSQNYMLFRDIGR